MGLLITRDGLKKLIDKNLQDGKRVVAPREVSGLTEYGEIKASWEMVWDYINPRNSFKEFLFPQSEVIASFRLGKGNVEIHSASPEVLETVVIGSRPCDAASTASLRSVFTWGEDEAPEKFRDEFFTSRGDKTTVISIACIKGDKDCFCTTVDLAPDSSLGSDLLLKETVNGSFLVSSQTKRGKGFIAEYKSFFKEGDEDLREVEFPLEIEGVDIEKIRKRLGAKDIYNHHVWTELARKCIGCGACTFSCPTCHCFDIVDEVSGYEGERRKNWDACQFEFFTLHASGHNPRDTQFKRWRNRFLCKFHIYPTKFLTTGCVGCGRCIRVCPVGLDITEVMEAVSR